MGQHDLHPLQLCLEIDVGGQGDIHVEGNLQQKGPLLALVNPASALGGLLNRLPELAVCPQLHAGNQLQGYLLFSQLRTQGRKRLLAPGKLFKEIGPPAMGGCDNVRDSLLHTLPGQFKRLFHGL